MRLDRRALLSIVGTSALAGLSTPRRAVDGFRTIRDRAAGPRLAGFAPLADGDPRSEPRRAPRDFAMLGVNAPPGAEVAVRVSSDGAHFGPWLPTAPLDVEREGPDGAEARRAGNAWKRMTTPVWTGEARWVQLRVEQARVDEVEVVLVGAPAHVDDAGAVGHGAPQPQPARWRAERDEPDLTLPVGGGLRIVTREEWGADESLRRGDPSYAERVLHGVVHHTAGNNSYPPEAGPRIVRGIYEYHVLDNGWNDIGYNLLVDRYGVVYEGRYGGLDLPVIGAHAAGANTGSFGVALLGDFRWDEVGWPEPRGAIFAVLLWKFGLHAIDPEATVTTAGGREHVPTLAGHRDVGSTECPGGRLHELLPPWRAGLAERLRTDLTDIEGHPHEANIRALRAAGITTGYADGTYRPEVLVSRAQMATFLTRAAQLEPGDEVTFHDVTPNHPHHAGIAAVAAAGISEGRADGTFRPDEEVTRGQMATFLTRALELDARAGTTFRDVPPTHAHHESVEAVAAAEIALGYDDGTFRPEQGVTRGQMASFLVRGFDLPPADEAPRDADDLDEPDEPDEIDDDDEHQVGGQQA
jgi:hypothetical protein